MIKNPISISIVITTIAVEHGQAAILASLNVCPPQLSWDN